MGTIVRALEAQGLEKAEAIAEARIVMARCKSHIAFGDFDLAMDEFEAETGLGSEVFKEVF